VLTVIYDVALKSIETIAKEHPLLQQFNMELTKYLMNNCEFKIVKQTHKVYYQGDAKSKDDWFYIILFGKLSLVRKSSDGEKRIITAMRIGRTAGEEAIIDKNYEKRTESCIAAQNSVIMWIPQEIVRKLRIGMELKTRLKPTVIVEKMITVLKRFHAEKRNWRNKYSEFYS